jgi:cytoskeletal protein CcmA (bactofilin family)
MAWLGRSLTLRGNLVASEDLTIDGAFEGTIDGADP